jgi:AcrR family transcriptional regulator
MSDVARVAGVSRSSLYKEFGSREGFARALLISDAEELLAAAFEALLTARSRSPLLAAAVAAGGGDLSALCAAPLDQLLEMAGERLVGVIAEAWPAIRRRDAAPLAHGLLRLAIGFVVLPDSAAGDSPAALAALLAPYADIVTACAPCQGTQRGLT